MGDEKKTARGHAKFAGLLFVVGLMTAYGGWVVMLAWGIFGPRFGHSTISYPEAVMLVLALAVLARILKGGWKHG